ncbi:cache domain-containing protein [Marinomonas colpomeniae]|uniref:Cache domain-containing protein n=1 Tax=Marinomonas colpomeniae TaxID=2774408 RepID=A0ABR8P598_9GAMM|nr:cache domain-containing protein [Marinomonas colpomeniae]MBD5772297.1 cache domain-containing protein [Marinomonas colpomeniae]
MVQAFLSAHQSTMKGVIKDVDRYDQSLKSLSTWWEKIALIGKINSFEVASTILQDMDNTLGQFNDLQERLIESLISEHVRKVLLQNTSRSQMAIDVLIRNLFERTADIGFLSTDYDVVQFLKKSHKNELDRDFIKQRLQAYVSIYSVYQDAFLLTPDGELVFQLSQPSRTGKVHDVFIEQVVKKPNDYVEYFGETELVGESGSNLLYANAVVEGGSVIGVIVLCFRFKDELEGIVGRLLAKREENHFLLLDGAGEILFAPQYSSSESSSKLSLNLEPQIMSFNRRSVMKVCAKGQSYQDYLGPKNWHVASLLPLDRIEGGSHRAGNEKKENTSLSTDFTGLISADLFDIRHQSVSINDDLQLIVLNGIITAARNDAVELMPVLEAIKKIGQDIDTVFDNSIESLFSTIVSGQLNVMRLQASLAVDIMDRNLFERANDCRWWGLSGLLRTALSASIVDRKSIQKTLATIHSLYTVYHTLYVYDKQGRYVAFSDDQYNDKIGQTIEELSGGKNVFQLETAYKYTVSAFEMFDCYQGKHTYIYNAALRDINGTGGIIGGIGIVFDSTVEFSAILHDILPRENGVIKSGSKALFTTDTGFVISSTSEEYLIGDTFLPDINLHELEEQGTIAAVIKLGGSSYLIGAAKSIGYREYKQTDGYENCVISWVLVPC